MDRLKQAWDFLREYEDFRSITSSRRKINEQIRNANIKLENIPWKSVVRAVLSRSPLGESELSQMQTKIDECYTENDWHTSQILIDLLGKDESEDLEGLWLEVNELKERIQRAIEVLPTSLKERKQWVQTILGYPESQFEQEEGTNEQHESISDLTQILTDDDQQKMRTGDLIEFSGNRLHDAYYVYRLPQKGIWSQIKDIWSKHQITEFTFQENSLEQEEILLIPAMDEYGYGVPYLFSTIPNEQLPSGALYKYVDINCPQVSKQIDNPTISLVQQHLDERLVNPKYQDRFIGEEIQVDLSRFPHEYVAMVYINESKDNIVWVHRAHYNHRSIARDLNDNRYIFYSRRILEAQEQYEKKNTKVT